MKHNRSQSICCGLGKMMAMTHPSKSVEINARRKNEFTATEAQTLVTYCATCTQAFQPPLDEIGAYGDGLHNRYAYHYLELVFGIEIDWEWFFTAYEEIYFELQELADEPQS
jgi:Fe-S oxidoreductase